MDITEKQVHINAAWCHECNDIIVSKYTHDFRTCSCGNVAVDGGNDYNRRLFIKHGSFTDLATEADLQIALRRKQEASHEQG